MTEQRLVCIGKVVKVHGVKGELKLIAYSGDVASPCGYEELYLAADQTSRAVASPTEKRTEGRTYLPGWFRIIRCRPQGKYTLVALEGVGQRDAAQALVGSEVHVDENALAPLAEDEFYWRELQGLGVVTDAGEEIGMVASLFSNGAHDVLVVKGKGGELYIPATKEFIIGIDPVARKLTIAPIPGLLEMNS